jgi:hypothetical protein
VTDPRDSEAYKRLEAAQIVEYEEGRGPILAVAYYTPDFILDAIRAVMGEIDVDPASCEVAQRRIQAKTFYTRENSGLENDWVGRVYLNPGYAPTEMKPFIIKAVEQCDNGNMTEHIIIVPTSVTWEPWFHTVLEMSQMCCFVEGKLEWTPAWAGYEKDLLEVGIDIERQTLSFNPAKGTVTVGKAAKFYSSHGVMFAYGGPNVKRFAEVFSEFGATLQKIS